jgi:hypothetical protein
MLKMVKRLGKRSWKLVNDTLFRSDCHEGFFEANWILFVNMGSLRRGLLASRDILGPS